MFQNRVKDVQSLYLGLIQDINRYLLHGLAECWLLSPDTTRVLLPETVQSHIIGLLSLTASEREQRLRDQDPEVPLWQLRPERTLWQALDCCKADEQRNRQILARAQTATSPWGQESPDESS